MPNLSRRHLVTTAAALPALAVPAFASDAIGPNHPDAELLRLGVELEAVIVDWRAQRAIDLEHAIAWRAALESAGLPDRNCDDFASFDEFVAYNRLRGAVEGPGFPKDEEDDEDPWDDIHGRIYPMIDAIMGQKAQTLAGFAVQARAVSLSHAELWDEGHAEGEHLHPFLEAACAFAGVVPVPTEAVKS
jgi:hypothetical protein